jgi:hypothetical protein
MCYHLPPVNQILYYMLHAEIQQPVRRVLRLKVSTVLQLMPRCFKNVLCCTVHVFIYVTIGQYIKLCMGTCGLNYILAFFYVLTKVSSFSTHLGRGVKDDS